MLVEFLVTFEKDLSKIKDKNVLDQIKQLLDLIDSAKNLGEIPNIKKLKGELNSYRIRIGNYRVGFFLMKNKIIFKRLLHRKDIYKYFP